MNKRTTKSKIKLISSRHQGSVLWLTLNRSNKSNAYNQTMLNELDLLIRNFEMDKTANVLVITGSGEKAFCAGADLKEIAGKTYESALDLKSANLFMFLSKLKKVTIAAINGAAFGGGLELALSCDLRICSTNATFAFPETGLGLIPAAGGTQRLQKVVGKGNAKELILAGEVWDAEKAMSKGLVNKVAEPDQLQILTQTWADNIALKDELALMLAKKAIDIEDDNVPGYLVEKISEALLYQIRHK